MKNFVADDFQSVDDGYDQLFAVLFGVQVGQTAHLAVFARYLDSRILSLKREPFITDIFQGIEANSIFSVVRTVIIELFAAVSRVFSEFPRSSIEEVTTRLADGGIIKSASDHRAHLVVFAIVGWVTMLYEPICDFQSFKFGLRKSNGDVQGLREKQELSQPLIETLNSLGLSLPSLGSFGDETITTQRYELKTSTLNAETLKITGQIHIRWVQTMGEHLLFDEKKRELMLFCFPSFCLSCQSAPAETTIHR